jgi:hypothetical protein
MSSSDALRKAVVALHASVDAGITAVIDAAQSAPGGVDVLRLEDENRAAKTTICTLQSELAVVQKTISDERQSTANERTARLRTEATLAATRESVDRLNRQLSESDQRFNDVRSDLASTKTERDSLTAQLRLEKESSGRDGIERALANLRTELESERQQRSDERQAYAAERIRSTIDREVDVTKARDEQIKKVGLLEAEIRRLQEQINQLQADAGRSRVPTFLGASAEDEIEGYLSAVFGQLFEITNVGKRPHCADIRLVARNGCVILIDIKNYGRVAPDSEIKKLHSDVDAAADAGTPVHGAIMFQKLGLRFKDGDIRKERRGQTIVVEIGSWLVDRLVEAIHEVYAAYSLALLQPKTADSKTGSDIGTDELTKLRDCISSLVNLAGRQASFSVVNFTHANDHRQDTMANCVDAHAKLAAAHSACSAGVSKQTLKAFEAYMPKHPIGRTRNPKAAAATAATKKPPAKRQKPAAATTTAKKGVKRKADGSAVKAEPTTTDNKTDDNDDRKTAVVDTERKTETTTVKAEPTDDDAKRRRIDGEPVVPASDSVPSTV